MADDPSIEELLAQLESGDQGAATKVFERYAERLVALARGRFQARLRSKVDAEDIVQSVFKSFFRAQGKGQFEFDDWGGLWRLLVTMTVRKCGRRAEEFYAARRDVGRERHDRGSAEDRRPELEVAAPDPTPDEAVALTELVERLISSLDDRGQQVFTLRLQGYTIPEISQQIGRTERTVHRTLDQIKQRLQRYGGSG
jgi:RNA polymerase sigma-70 factor, ECF subfamily